MSLFGSSNESYLGIDLSKDSIKVVELVNENNLPRLVTYGYTESKGEELQGHFIENKNITSTTLKEICSKAKTSSKVALAALPISQVFTSIINLHGVDKKDLNIPEKIKHMITEEAKKITPIPIDQMLFDYTIINTAELEKMAKGKKYPNVKFFITAASNDLVKKYSEIFKQAGLNLSNLDIEPFALIKSLVGNDKSLIMVVDIGENISSLSIVDEGVPLMNRTILVGSGAITKQISGHMQISLEDAEQYKLDMDVLMQQQNLQELPKPVQTGLTPILAEIKYLIKTYAEQVSAEKQIDKLILTGGGSIIATLPEYFATQLNIRTYLGDPWARVIYPQELKGILQQIGPRFSVAAGLAMREIVD